MDPDSARPGRRRSRLVEVGPAPCAGRGLGLRLLAAADDVAHETGARSTATWVADQTRQAHGTVRRHATLAAALDRAWVQTAAAFAAGEVNLAQAQVIADALDALPADLGEDLLAKAETLLVTEAADLGPRQLKVFGSRVLEYLAPEIAEDAEYQRLLAQPSAAPTPPRSCSSGPAATGPPTSTPGSPTTSPTGSRPTSTATPHRATSGSAMSTSCPCPDAAARRSAPCWRTCPPPGCPGRAAPPPPSRSPSTWPPCWPTSAPPASRSPPPVTGSPPTRPAGWPARPGSCRS